MFPNIDMHLSPLLQPEFFKSVHVFVLLCNSFCMLVPKTSPKCSGFSFTKASTHFKSRIFINWFPQDDFLPSIGCAKYAKCAECCLLPSLTDRKDCLVLQPSHGHFYTDHPSSAMIHILHDVTMRRGF